MRITWLVLALPLLFAAPVHAAAPAACPGDPIQVDRAITGEFDRSQQGSYVLVPFDVPAGTTSVRVKYCHDQPESPTSAQLKHTLDLGLYDGSLTASGGFWGEISFRGWGGSSHPDVTITPQGFSSEEQYKEKPKGHVPGRTTRGFVPGPIPDGTWAAELGVAAVVSQAEGDLDGKVAWRVEVELSSDPSFAAQPYAPAAYDDAPVKGAGWYEGDLHVHGEHSALGDATMTEVFDYGFNTAGLDFITLSDYVTTSAWGEIGRHQGRHPGKLVARSAEVITYRGHFMNHASGQYVDYRTGPIYVRQPDGSLERRFEGTPPRDRFEAIHDRGGWNQINHPTIFPSETPGFANLCRGCPWDYSDQETQWDRVDSYEVHTGPPGFGGAGPNPFTVTAIQEWDGLRNRGFPITGVAVSDSHDAGQPDGPTESPIGIGRTVVYTDELSEEGVRRGVQAGHAYVKLFGAASPDLRLEARSADGRRAIMGDALPSRRAEFTARVTGGDSTMQLIVLRDGQPVQTVPVTGSDFEHAFTGASAGNYRLQVQQGQTIHSLTNPITLGAAPRTAPRAPRGGGRAATIVLRATPKRVRAGRRVRFTFTARTRSGALLPGATVRFAGRRVVTDSRGVGRISTSLRSPRVYRATAAAPGYRSGRVGIRATGRGRALGLTG